MEPRKKQTQTRRRRCSDPVLSFQSQVSQKFYFCILNKAIAKSRLCIRKKSLCSSQVYFGISARTCIGKPFVDVRSHCRDLSAKPTRWGKSFCGEAAVPKLLFLHRRCEKPHTWITRLIPLLALATCTYIRGRVNKYVDYHVWQSRVHWGNVCFVDRHLTSLLRNNQNNQLLRNVNKEHCENRTCRKMSKRTLVSWRELHPFKVLSVVDQALSASSDPIQEASPPLLLCDLAQLSFHSNLQPVQISKFTPFQSLLQQRK